MGLNGFYILVVQMNLERIYQFARTMIQLLTLDRWGQRVQTQPWKITSGYRFPKNSGMDPPQEAFGPNSPKRSNCFSKEVRTALCEIR